MVNAVPEPIILPVIFNVDKHVDAPCNVVLPLTFNDDTNVEALLKLGIVGGLNILL